MRGGHFKAGCHVVFVPADTDTFPETRADAAIPRLLVSDTKTFNATRSRWTFGGPLVSGGRVKIQYHSHVAPRFEVVAVEDVRIVGRAVFVVVDGRLAPLTSN
jgi:hypothetical protein